jgi:hypothetical protein
LLFPTDGTVTREMENWHENQKKSKVVMLFENKNREIDI